jgi:radical SAM protein with 4Fe4S-binding SPASM domain
MSPDQARDIFSLFISNAATPSLSAEISGGEPLLCGCDWLAAVCAHVRAMEANCGKHVNLWITTNGTLLTEQFVEVLRKYQVIVSIGLDAPGGSEKGLKTLDGRSRPGIGLLQEFYHLPGINAVATQPAAKHIEQFMDVLRTWGVRQFRFTAFNDRGRIRSAPELIPTVDEAVDYTIRLLRYMERCDFSIVETDALDRVYRFMGDRYQENFCYSPNCPAGSGFLAVDAKGDVYPCGFETRERFLLGNLYDGYDEKRRNNALSAYHGQSAPLLRCVFCRSSRICHFGCAGCMHDGNSRHFDAECQLTQRLFEHLEQDPGAVERYYRQAKDRLAERDLSPISQ